jgi:hypothetical protein
MMSKNLLDEPVFGVWMNHAQEGSEGGELVLGGTNKKHYDSKTLGWANVIRKGLHSILQHHAD